MNVVNVIAQDLEKPTEDLPFVNRHDILKKSLTPETKLLYVSSYIFTIQ